MRSSAPYQCDTHLPGFRLLADFAPLPGDPGLIPAARSLVPAASSSGGMIALTAPAAAPAMTLTAVFFSVLVAPLFLLATRLPPDFWPLFLIRQTVKMISCDPILLASYSSR